MKLLKRLKTEEREKGGRGKGKKRRETVPGVSQDSKNSYTACGN